MCTAVLLAAAPSAAFPTYLSRVPNGGASSCLTCHESMRGGEGWNAFGQDILRQGGVDPTLNPDDQNNSSAENAGDPSYRGPPVWDGTLCGADSDADGQSNGEELGDPVCRWSRGDEPARDCLVALPGDASSVSAAPAQTEPCDAGAATDANDAGAATFDAPAPGGCRQTPASSAAALALLAAPLRRRRRASPFARARCR